STASNEASAVAATAPPPTGVTATARIGGVTLSWASVPGATSYNVYLGTSAGGESATPAVGTVNNALVVSPLTPETTYYFIVRSVVGGVSGTASSEVSPPVLPTPAPAGLSATAGPGQVVLNWGASQTATSYGVYWCGGGTVLTPVS